MTAIKGYVVRGKRSDGTNELIIGPTPTEARDFAVVRGCTDVAIFRVHADGTEERLPSYEEALALLDGATTVDAYLANVSTQLLATMRENDRLRALLGGDPLAALEAAERRLLKERGWTPMEGDPDFWVKPGGDWRFPMWEAAKVARYEAEIERRLAAKGGV